MLKISLTPTIPAGPMIASGPSSPTAPATAASIPANVLRAWETAAPMLGSQSAANSALTTPSALGVHAASMPEWNQEFYKQLSGALDRVWRACTGAFWQTPDSLAPHFITPADRQNLIRDAIAMLQSVASKGSPEQQKEINQVISQLQIACSLEGTPLGNPNAYLNEAISGLNDLLSSDPDF